MVMWAFITWLFFLTRRRFRFGRFKYSCNAECSPYVVLFRFRVRQSYFQTFRHDGQIKEEWSTASRTMKQRGGRWMGGGGLRKEMTFSHHVTDDHKYFPRLIVSIFLLQSTNKQFFLSFFYLFFSTPLTPPHLHRPCFCFCFFKVHCLSLNTVEENDILAYRTNVSSCPVIISAPEGTGMDITWLLTTVRFNLFRTESSFKLARTVFCPNWPPAIADWGVARPLTPSVLVFHGVFALAIEADDTSRLIDSVVNGCPMLKACMRLALNEEAPLAFSLWKFYISPVRSAARLEDIQQVLRTVQNCARPAIAGVISFISDDSQFTAIFFSAMEYWRRIGPFHVWFSLGRCGDWSLLCIRIIYMSAITEWKYLSDIRSMKSTESNIVCVC